MNLAHRLAIALLALLPISAAISQPLTAPQIWVGTVTSTTTSTTVTGRLELSLNGETINGFLTLDAPLPTGRWPVTGVRKGAWCELVCLRGWPDAPDGSKTVLSGVFGAGEFRGTLLHAKKGSLLEYGRFRLRSETAAR